VPTLVAALTLAALLRLAQVEMPRWHLAFWFALLVAAALAGSMSRAHLALNAAGSFLASWAYFVALDRTDGVGSRALHYLILVFGMMGLIASRLWLDLREYGIGL
jgi:hypothetical protein